MHALLLYAIASLARRVAPCIMYCENLPFLLPRRSGSVLSSYRQNFNANFLAAWDGACSGNGSSGDGKWVLVVAARERDPRAIALDELLYVSSFLDLPRADACILHMLLRGEDCGESALVMAAWVPVLVAGEGWRAEVRGVTAAEFELAQRMATEGSGAAALVLS